MIVLVFIFRTYYLRTLVQTGALLIRNNIILGIRTNRLKNGDSQQKYDALLHELLQKLIHGLKIKLHKKIKIRRLTSLATT